MDGERCGPGRARLRPRPARLSPGCAGARCLLPCLSVLPGLRRAFSSGRRRPVCLALDVAPARRSRTCRRPGCRRVRAGSRPTGRPGAGPDTSIRGSGWPGRCRGAGHEPAYGATGREARPGGAAPGRTAFTWDAAGATPRWWAAAGASTASLRRCGAMRSGASSGRCSRSGSTWDGLRVVLSRVRGPGPGRDGPNPESVPEAA